MVFVKVFEELNEIEIDLNLLIVILQIKKDYEIVFDLIMNQITIISKVEVLDLGNFDMY